VVGSVSDKDRKRYDNKK